MTNAGVARVDGRSEGPAADPRDVRYGIFLRPDPATAERTLRGFDIARCMFGFTAAAAYPPHATLVGSIDLTVDESELIAAIDRVLADPPAQQLETSALDPWDGAALVQLVRDAGETRIGALAGALLTAIAPLRRVSEGDFAAGIVGAITPETFRAHVTVVGHDGADRPEQLPDVLAFMNQLGFDQPIRATWDTATLYRFRSDDWQGRYWETMTWEIVRNWRLRG